MRPFSFFERVITASLIAFFLPSLACAATYYVDATGGSDSNNGLSTGAAWQTISKVNASSFQAGDSILFKRGETWRGDTLQPASSGSTGNPIIFGAYGSGNKPVINAISLITGSWTVSGAEYYTSLASAPQVVWSDNVLLTPGSGVGALSQGQWFYDSGTSRLYVRLSGDANPSGAVIEWAAQVSTYGNAGASIRISNKSNITIENIEARPKWNSARGRGIVVDGGSGTASNITIRDCTVTSDKYNNDTFLIGILVTKAPNVTIINNDISHTSYGIQLLANIAAGFSGTVSGNTIHDIDANTSITEWDGIKLDSTVAADWGGMTIQNNDISRFNEDGIDLLNAENGVYQYNYIHDSVNIRTNDNQSGIKSAKSNNIFRYNRIINIAASGGANRHGIIVNGYNEQVYNNIISNVLDYGILSNNSNNPNLSGNSIYNNSVRAAGIAAIRAGDGVVDIQIKNNIGSGGTEKDITFRGSTTVATGGYNMHVNNTTAHILTSATYSASTTDLYQTNPLWMNGSGVFSAATDFTLQTLSSAIDAGTNLNLTTDYAGNPIYGTPDIGAYEYQPPYTAGSDRADISGNIRVYGDGKFRNRSTPSGQTAMLAITPASGDKTKWIDIGIGTWTSAQKSWHESSPNMTGSVSHLVGDLEPGRSYTLKIDGGTPPSDMVNGCSGGVCVADSSGKVHFIYLGGYSGHDFSLTQIPLGNGPPGLIAPIELIAPSGGGGGASTPIAMTPTQPASSTPAASSTPSTASSVKSLAQPAAPAFTRALWRGNRGVEVSALQTFLAKDKTLYPEGLVTGYFGPATWKALMNFQCRERIVCEGDESSTGWGSVGPKTRAKLNELASLTI